MMMRAALAGILLLLVDSIPATAGLFPFSIDPCSQDRYSDRLQANDSLQKIAKDKDELAKEREKFDKDKATADKNKEDTRRAIEQDEKGKEYIIPRTSGGSTSPR
jgi:hypothetical protein